MPFPTGICPRAREGAAQGKAVVSGRPSIAHLSFLRQPKGDLVVTNASQCPPVHSSGRLMGEGSRPPIARRTHRELAS